MAALDRFLAFLADDDGLSTTQTAAVLDKSVDALERMHGRGEGPPRERFGNVWIYRVGRLKRWRTERARAPEAA